jgi:hypothetical protein
LESLKNRKNHTYIIEKIRMKMKELEMQNWKIEFSWIKAHAGHHGKELADQLAKEAAPSNGINECYKRIPKSSVLSELSEFNVTKRQSEWDLTTKGTITKSFFPKIAESLKLKTNITPNYTTMVTGYRNINSYLHKYKILDSITCSCKNGEQTVDHI